MTLATSALALAIQLGRANSAGTSIIDLEDQIKAEIGEAIRFYNRKPWHVTEWRTMTLTTVADTQWYSTVDMTTGAGDQAANSRTTLNVNDILDIQYIRENTTGIEDTLRQYSYREFEQLNEGSSSGGTPYGYTLYAGQIGIYPVPTTVYTVTLSGHVKPVVPTADGDTSVWLDQAEELILAAAGKRVATKHLQDMDRAGMFAAVEQSAEMQFHEEHIRKTSTGKIRPHD